MSEAPSLRFSFQSRALAEDAFWVVDFQGREGLCLDYEFDVHLLASRPDLDLDALLAEPASFIIHRPDGDVYFHGMLTQVEQDQDFHGMYFYRAVLAPRLWRLNMIHGNQVFLDQDPAAFLTELLLAGGLTTADFELRLNDSYEKHEYVCQYGESHHKFLTRWLEREGLYYYFEQGSDREKLIITDTRISGVKRQGFPDLHYDPLSGLEDPFKDHLILEFNHRRQKVPRHVLTNDYNEMKPSLDLLSQSDVSSDGLGQVYYWGDNYRTQEEGERLAGIRAEALRAEEVMYSGRSICPYLASGYVYQLNGHYRDEFNSEYLVSSVEHQGSQTEYLVRGLGLDRELGLEMRYENRFKGLPASIQYRPSRRTPKPVFRGALNAAIDAEGSGEYAALDEHGRYKIRLPFDLSGRAGGKASHWIRMAQPTAGSGSDYGLHAPLHKGTEVLLTFIDGDPDRPIIAGAVPNPEDASPVTAENLTKSVLSTAGGNLIEFNDEKGLESILLSTPQSDTWIRLGSQLLNSKSSNDDDKGEGGGEGEDGWWGNTEHDTGICIFGKCNTKVGRNVTNIVIGGQEKVVVLHENVTIVGLDTAINLGARIKVEYPYKWECNLGELFSGDAEEEAAIDKIKLIEQHIQALDAKNEALNEQIDLFNQRADAANENSEIIDSKLTSKFESMEVYNLKTRAAESEVQALDNKIEAVNTQIEQNQTKIKAVTDLTEVANTSVENCQAKLLTIESERVKMGSLINDDGMIIKG